MPFMGDGKMETIDSKFISGCLCVAVQADGRLAGRKFFHFDILPAAICSEACAKSFGAGFLRGPAGGKIDETGLRVRRRGGLLSRRAEVIDE